MPRPRILILSTAYLPLIGGSELAIRHIADRLTEYDFDMVTGRYGPNMAVMEQVGRVRVFRAGGRFSRLSLVLPKLLMPLAMAVTAWRLTHRHHYALIHAYQASQAAGAGAILKIIRPRTPLVVTLQEGKELDHQSLPVRVARAVILRLADRVTAISTYLADYARRYTRAPIDIIPNGVDIDALEPAQAHVPQNEKMIISISRLVPKNGIANLIRSLPLILHRVSARLVLVGDGPLKSELVQLVEELQVSGHVDFVGSVSHDHLPRYLHEADVFVRPSISEGLGSAFLEAMAARVPVVASPVGGIVDFLKDGETGLACDPADPENIAVQIIRILTDEPLRRSIIERAFSMVRERYTWAAVAAAMDRVYKHFI